ncbi:thiamine biosynthesis protein [Salmonella bongori]|nr:thiamine biosynthesis protein [Salmonella bongori]
MEMTFCRAVLLAITFLFMGCDEAPKTAVATPAAQVLEGKTMGTFWRVSVVGIDAKRAAMLQTKNPDPA